jgi:hypothetical protein
MLQRVIRLAFPGSLVLGLVAAFAVTAGLVWAASPSVSYDAAAFMSSPTTKSFDIGFVKNDIGKYILADRTNNAVDLFDATAPSFTGYIGQGGFVGLGQSTLPCGAPHACAGPNGDLIDSSNNVWAGDGPASYCTTTACPCYTGETTSMVKEYSLAPSSGTTGRLACLDTGGKYRADEMAFDPRDDLLLVANDADGFVSLIRTSGTPAIVDQFYYADNDVGKPASVSGLSTAGGGIEQSVWDPQQGFFYLAIPSGTTVGRVDVFNPKPGRLVYLRSIDVPGCDGPTGLALDPSTREFLGACSNGAALIKANSGKSTIIGSATTTGGADEVWFDPGSNAWYLSSRAPQLGVVSAASDHAVQDVMQPGCCGHSVAAYSGSGSSFIFDPNTAGTGISVFKATP